MPINARLNKLERSLARRPVHSEYDQAQADRLRRLIMSDPEAHGLAVQLAELLASSGRAAEATAASSALAERLNCLAA